MVESTKLQAANVAKSLRTTVPMPIVKQLRLNEGDYLDWDMDKKDNELDSNSQKKTRVRPN